MKALILILFTFIGLLSFVSYQTNKRDEVNISNKIRCKDNSLLEGDIMIVRKDTIGYYIQKATINNVKQFLDSTE